MRRNPVTLTRAQVRTLYGRLESPTYAPPDPISRRALWLVFAILAIGLALNYLAP